MISSLRIDIFKNYKIVINNYFSSLLILNSINELIFKSSFIYVLLFQDEFWKNC
jgi:hypothetical protein